MAEEPFLYVRGTTAEDDDLDTWDDTLLIQMWDRSLEKVKKGIIGDFSKEKNQETNDWRIPGKRKDSTEKESGHANATGTSDLKSSGYKPKQKMYKVGQRVRAVFSVDQKQYEAIITAVMPWKNSCIVKFTGYGNSEKVLFGDLSESHGPISIKNQILQARNENAEEDSDTLQQFEDPEENEMELEHEEPQVKVPDGLKCNYSNPESKLNRQQQTRFKNEVENPCHPTIHFQYSSAIPSAVPPNLNTLSHQSHSKQEAYSSMLMSWYLSGYHTGYYEGLKHGKKAALASLNKHNQPPPKYSYQKK